MPNDGHFNGDGVADLATGNFLALDVSELLGTGTGSFLPATNYPIVGTAEEVLARDLNGDGRSNLVVFGEPVFGVGAALSDDGGQFGPFTIYASGSPRGIAPGQFGVPVQPGVAVVSGGDERYLGSLTILCSRIVRPK